MSLGATIWLWMLAAAIIPVVIHLWSRKSGRPKMLPTFRFLPDKSVARASRIELHEKSLLLLRLLLILLLTLLLTGLFVDRETDSFDSVLLTESDSNETKKIENDDVLEIQLPQKKIDKMGWFQLIDQYDYDYRPGLIVVDGVLTANRFQGILPKISADVQWNGRELVAEKELATWIGSENKPHVLKQIRSILGVETEILPLPDTSSDTLSPLQILINQNADTAIKEGFQQVASLWNVSIEEENLEAGVVALITHGENDIRLMRPDTPKKDQFLSPPGPLFGIRMSLDVADSSYFEQGKHRINRKTDSQVLEKTENGHVQLNAEPDPGYAEWFYAGVAHQLLKNAVGIKEAMEPELTSDQRKSLDEAIRSGSGRVQNRSASSILLAMLLIVWVGERLLSNRRGM